MTIPFAKYVEVYTGIYLYSSNLLYSLGIYIKKATRVPVILICKSTVPRPAS